MRKGHLSPFGKETMTQEEIKEIILKNIYRTDFVNPRLPVLQQAVLDQFFSRTILIGRETVKLSLGHLQKLTGISIPTLSKTLKRLVSEGYLEIVSEWKPKVPIEYRVRLDIPTDLKTFFQPQRSPKLVFNELFLPEEAIGKFELTAEGHAAISSIKEGMSVPERELYMKKVRQELLIQGAELTEKGINDRFVEILLRSVSDEKKRKWIKTLKM